MEFAKNLDIKINVSVVKISTRLYKNIHVVITYS